MSYLDSTERALERETFLAKKEGTTIAEAESLEELARSLRSKGVDWRSVLITSNPPPPSIVHLGFRVRPK